MDLKEMLINLIDIENTPFYKKLEIIDKYDEIELTKKGNFKQSLVKELVDSGIYFNIDGYNEDNYFEIKLFKNLLLKNRYFRKNKDKLIKVKKYQNMPLKEKFIAIFLSLETKDIIYSLTNTISFVDNFVNIESIDKLIAIALYSVYKNENDLFSKILSSIIFEFGILKDNKLILEIQEEKITQIIDIEDINKKSANLFIDSILDINKEYSDEEIEIIQRFINTYHKFANMEDENDKWYYEWIEKMAEYIDVKRLNKEIELLIKEVLLVSDKVKEDLVNVILMLENLKKIKKDERMFIVMTLIEIFLNKNFGLFEG